VNGLPFPLGERLGVGGFAEVYAVEGREQATVVKVARSAAPVPRGITGGVFFAHGVRFHTGSHASWTPKPNDVLAAEAGLLRRISHAAFPRVLDQGSTADGRSYLLLQRIEGVTWREALSGAAPPGLGEFRKLVEALDQVEHSGQLSWHGDIKPENLMLTSDRAVHVLDPASGFVDRGSGMRVRSLLATEAYNPTFETSDVFALGLLLIELLGGQHPLLAAPAEGEPTHSLSPALLQRLNDEWTAGRTSALLQRIRTMKLPSEQSPTLSKTLEEVALRCLSLKRDGRHGLDMTKPFESVGALGVALRNQ
jgi:serine/threonine protein kinase